MSNLYRGPSKDASYQVLKQEWIVAALFVNVTLMGKITVIKSLALSK
jgi:hypothetical protein